MRLISVLTILTFSQFALSADVSVRFGSLYVAERVGESGYRFSFLEELDRVPLLTLSEGGAYGIEYSAPEEHSYRVQVTAILPPGTKPGGGDVESVSTSLESTVMVFEERTFKGTFVEPFLFSKGDLTGTYILKVRVNGAEHSTIRYQTYVPESH